MFTLAVWELPTFLYILPHFQKHRINWTVEWKTGSWLRKIIQGGKHIKKIIWTDETKINMSQNDVKRKV